MFATDFDAWERWTHSRHRLRQYKHMLKQRLAPQPEESLFLHQRGESPKVVVALDHISGTFSDALLAPLEFLESAAVVTRGELPRGYLGDGWVGRKLADFAELPGTLEVVMSPGSFRAVSLPLHAWARERNLRFVVSQHGLLTPFGPPLPEDVELVAWFDADVDFWAAGRDDVTGVALGSQLLWRAAQSPAAVDDRSPLFLGQLHGAELPRREVARVSEAFCREAPAVYRPHPAEKDILSRVIHGVWRRRGITFDDGGVPLQESSRPVTSIFSTGLLEAAARGLPSWGVHPQPPAWLEGLWERYHVGKWGGPPTPSPAADPVSPAELIANYLDN